MGFWLKKAVSIWLMPLPFCLVLLIAGAWLMHSAARARLGRRLVLAGVLLLLVFSQKTLSVWLVQPLESVYPAIPEIAAGAPLPDELARCRYVVVLGSGHSDNVRLAANNQLCSAAHGRLIEALRLLRLLPEARLIATGPGRPGFLSHGEVIGQAAVSLGLERARCIALPQVRDTEDESLAIKQIVGDAPFVLVTSAWHMPRAMMLMRRAGLHAVAAPADYTARQGAPGNWGDALWDVEALERSTAAIHEALGLAWVWLKGRA